MQDKNQKPIDNKQKTLMFPVKEQQKEALREQLQGVYESLVEKGYNPINQIVGYIISEDPTYVHDSRCSAKGCLERGRNQPACNLAL